MSDHFWLWFWISVVCFWLTVFVCKHLRTSLPSPFKFNRLTVSNILAISAVSMIPIVNILCLIVDVCALFIIYVVVPILSFYHDGVSFPRLRAFLDKEII